VFTHESVQVAMHALRINPADAELQQLLARLEQAARTRRGQLVSARLSQTVRTTRL
jgi:hypothetical protein